MPVEHLAVDAVTTAPTTTLEDAARTMQREGLGDLVVTEHERPVGIVTDRDVTMAVADGVDPAAATVDDVMSADPVTIRGSAEAVELPAKMAEGKVRRIPVVDGQERLVGVATLDDVVATVGEELADVATVIEAQSPDYEP